MAEVGDKGKEEFEPMNTVDPTSINSQNDFSNSQIST